MIPPRVTHLGPMTPRGDDPRSTVYTPYSALVVPAIRVGRRTCWRIRIVGLISPVH